MINFAIKEEGLLAQLLGLVVKKEKPQLEEMKNHIVTTISGGKKTLQSLEDELLRLLYESRGSLLENKELFDTLQTSKVTSQAVKESVEVKMSFVGMSVTLFFNHSSYIFFLSDGSND